MSYIFKFCSCSCLILMLLSSAPTPVLPHLSKGQLSKETMVQGTNVQETDVQGGFGPRRLLSKEAFTSDQLAQITFFYSLLDIMILTDYRKTKK